MIAGWIDLSRVGLEALPTAPARAPAVGTARYRAEGIEVEVSGPDCWLAHDGARIVVCQGQPRFHDSAAHSAALGRGASAGWMHLWTAQEAPRFAAVAGSYAVVLLDLHLRTALLACDRFAIQSLCYARDGSRLIFGDRADTVAAMGEGEIDPQALYDYFYFHTIPAPRTIFRGVQRLPAAHIASARAGEIKLQAHWVPDFSTAHGSHIDTLKSEFRSLIREAVQRESASGTVGAFLSGGTDSSTVAGMLGDVTARPAPTYSIGFDADGYDEAGYANLSARHFGTDHHAYYLTPDDLVRSIPQVAQYYDQPFGNSSALPAYYCARIAKNDGVTKLLAGDGGDELFGGNTRYVTQQIFQLYHAVPASLRSRVIEPLLGQKWLADMPVLRKVSRYVAQARLPMPDRMNTYNLLEWLGVSEVLEEGFLAEIDMLDPMRRQREAYSRVKGSFVNEMLAYDWKFTLADNDLPKVCGTAALAGITVGFPLLADEIVDFALRLPASLKVRGFKLRYFFKEALRGYLPQATLAKKKHGFGLPFGPWLTQHAGLHEFARSSLAALGDRGIVKRRFIDELLRTRLNEHPRFFGEMVWILIMLEQWLARGAPRRYLTLPGR